MGRLEDTEWWWNVALDDIGGAIVAGMVTLLVLVAALRHERRRSHRQVMTDECIRLVERARAMFARAFEGQSVDPLVTWDFIADLRVVSRRARDDYPDFARLLGVVADVVFVAMTAAHTGKGAPANTNPVQFASDTLQNVQDVLNRWIANHKFYEKMRDSQLTRRTEAIVDGAPFFDK